MKGKFYAVVRTVLYWPVRLIFRVRIVGSENEPKDSAYLVCANHQSVLDPIFICAAVKRYQPHFMAKAELFRVPVLGKLVTWLGAYPVSRGKGDVGAVKRTVDLLKSGRTVGMFPQGTRCQFKQPRECKIKFGAGLIATQTEVPVLPIHIKIKEYKWRFFRRVTLVVGKPITFAELGYDPTAAGESARIASIIFEEICRLGDSVK